MIQFLLYKFTTLLYIFYQTPLIMAIKNNNDEIVALLLSNPEIKVDITCILKAYQYLQNSKI